LTLITIFSCALTNCLPSIDRLRSNSAALPKSPAAYARVFGKVCIQYRIVLSNLERIVGTPVEQIA